MKPDRMKPESLQERSSPWGLRRTRIIDGSLAGRPWTQVTPDRDPESGDAMPQKLHGLVTRVRISRLICLAPLDIAIGKART
jgi:hypothetical protein